MKQLPFLNLLRHISHCAHQSYDDSEKEMGVNLILQMRKLRLREGKEPARGHPTNIWASNPTLASTTVLLLLAAGPKRSLLSRRFLSGNLQPVLPIQQSTGSTTEARGHAWSRCLGEVPRTISALCSVCPSSTLESSFSNH